ncbi:Ni/Fe hydrogenase subunit alpha [Candidatus Woesearchaeota archaeon]|nr:Ni/Fe hydrogenase subunit alpha [Candidatus Woesearchaeota archaeon]
MGEITLNHITKVEGHARLDLKIEDGKVLQCDLGSVEGSRYFEGLLVGRRWNEVQEITTRICGICSSAHNVAAIMAMENCLGVKPTKQTITLRMLQTIGERIRSHAAHLYVLALPDYLGYKSAIEMAPKFKNEISRALRLMKLGNDMVRFLTGRVIHPISPTIGGFLHFPEQSVLDEIKQRLIDAEEDIIETCKLFQTLEYPEFENPTQYMSIYKEDEFGTSQGKIKVDGKELEMKDLHDFAEEYHESFSSCNFVVKDGKSYSVGALARFNNNLSQLSPQTKEFMKQCPIKYPSDNPFHNIMAQALELIHYRETCIDILSNLKIQHEELAKVDIKEGHGIAANEAPRGTLWHEYKTDKDGFITYANIITPTAQFLRNLNDDIRAYVQKLVDEGADKEKIVFEIERLIRSYDPCFSCSSHFLKVNWK